MLLESLNESWQPHYIQRQPGWISLLSGSQRSAIAPENPQPQREWTAPNSGRRRPCSQLNQSSLVGTELDQAAAITLEKQAPQQMGTIHLGTVNTYGDR